MYNPVLPHGQRPVFLQTNVDHIFTRIAVDRVAAADGHYDVLFIGTGMCASLLFWWVSIDVQAKFLFAPQNCMLGDVPSGGIQPV